MDPTPGHIVNAVRTAAGLLAALFVMNTAVAASAEPPSTEAPRTTVEALIDGPSELRVTQTGIYWINIRNAKPGRHERRDEPTYVNDKPWKPAWKKPGEERGSDTSDPYPLKLDPGHLQFELLAVGDTHGATGIQKRSPITVKKVGADLSILIPDPESGSRWYRFALIEYKGPEPFPLVIGSGSKAGSPAAPNPVAATNPPAAVDVGALVKAHRGNLVSISFPNGPAGAGFIAKIRGTPYVVTNTHVLASGPATSFKTLDGTQVQTGAPSSAVGHDIIRLAGPNAGDNPLEAMEQVDVNTSIGDGVVILGHGGGAGVVKPIQGRLVGVGPNLVETDAQFQQADSGSPIVHLKTGKVIGVAAYLTIRKYDSATREPVKEPVIRRFGFRIDSATIWQPVKWDAFYAQSTELAAIEKLTQDFGVFIKDLAKNGTITRYLHTNPAIKNRIDQWIDAKSKHLSPRDAELAEQSLLSFLKVASQSDITAARQHFTYDYFQRQLVEQERERTAIGEILERLVKSL